MQIAIVLYPGDDRPGRHRALRGPTAAARHRGALRQRRARTGPHRQRGAVPRRHPQLHGDPEPGPCPGARLRAPDRDHDGRQAADRLATAGARDDALDHVGLYRSDDPRRRRYPRRPARDDALDCAVWVAAMGATAQHDQRIVHAGKVAAAAGVSAGIDLGLWLADEIAGREQAETIQLYIEHDPQPPFDAGHPSKASKTVVANAKTLGAGSRSTPPRCARSRRSPGSARSTSSARGGDCPEHYRGRGGHRVDENRLPSRRGSPAGTTDPPQRGGRVTDTRSPGTRHGASGNWGRPARTALPRALDPRSGAPGCRLRRVWASGWSARSSGRSRRRPASRSAAAPGRSTRCWSAGPGDGKLSRGLGSLGRVS
jgi:hypothetical protein